MKRHLKSSVVFVTAGTPQANRRGDSAVPHNIGQLQQLLLKDGCYLVGVPNRDPTDLARLAKPSAPEVINGWNRESKGLPHGAPWSPSNPVILEWEQAQRIREVHLSINLLRFAARLGIEVDTPSGWQSLEGRRCLLPDDLLRAVRLGFIDRRHPVRTNPPGRMGRGPPGRSSIQEHDAAHHLERRRQRGPRLRDQRQARDQAVRARRPAGRTKDHHPAEVGWLLVLRQFDHGLAHGLADVHVGFRVAAVVVA